MSMMPSKLEAMFVVKFFGKGSTLGNPMIVTKVFDCAFELRYANIKLKVWNNGDNG